MGWRKAFTLGFVIAALLAAATCGGRKQPSAVSYQSSDNRVAPPVQPAADISLEDALAELEEMECPEGVDQALWAELKDALGEALICRAGSPCPALSKPHSPAGAAQRPRPTGDKFVSTPPTGEANRINDLAIIDNGDGTFALTWHYRNLGDYDQDGTVAVEDIIPLAEHFGETYESEDVNCVQAVIDGSGSGRIGIEDITPIAMNFAVEVEHYAVEGAAEEAGTYELVSEIAQDAGTPRSARLEYSTIIESPAALWHRVVPCDAEGAPGEASNAVLRPSNEPIIYEVSPTEGYQHEEYTFSATVSGAEPLAYAWDFGGGANPDTSTETSPTVTLADAGEYSASLTVTNTYGEALWPFTLTVNERDMWAHTWSQSGRDSANSLTVDEDGNIWVVGSRLLKFTPSGELLLARSLGGDDLVATSDSEIWVVGDSDSLGPGQRDVLLLKYDLDGNLLLAKTWGGDWIDVATAMTVDQSGNLYITGSRANEPFGDNDLLLLKYDPEGNSLFSVALDGGRNEGSQDVAVTDSGDVFLVGGVSDIGGPTDALIVKFSSEGELEWAKTSAEGERLGFSVIELGPNGDLYSGGGTSSYGAGLTDFLLTKFDTDGNIVFARTWGTQESEGAIGLTVDGRGNVYLVGLVSDENRFTDGILLKCNSEGDLLQELRWNGNENGLSTLNAAAVDGMDNLYVSGRAAHVQGAWEVVNGTVTSLAPELFDCEVEVYEPLYVETQLEGLESSQVVAYIDTEFDVLWPDQALVLKNFGT